MTTAAKGRDDAWTGTRSCCVLGSHFGRQRQLRHQYRGQTSSPSPPGLGDVCFHGQALSLQALFTSVSSLFPSLLLRIIRRYGKAGLMTTIFQVCKVCSGSSGEGCWVPVVDSKHRDRSDDDGIIGPHQRLCV